MSKIKSLLKNSFVKKILSVLFLIVCICLNSYAVVCCTSLVFKYYSYILVVRAVIIVLFSFYSKEDILYSSILLCFLSIISAFIYFGLEDFPDIITVGFTIICDIIINELFETKANIIKAKYDTNKCKTSFNESYFELYFNHKKAITKIFLYVFLLCIIITNSLINITTENNHHNIVFKIINKYTIDNKNFLEFLSLIQIVSAISALISVLIIDFVLKNEKMNTLFKLRKDNHKLMISEIYEKDIIPFLGDYTDEEIQTLEGEYNYLLKTREIRERIYALLVKETFEKDNNKPNPIKYLDEILEGSESNKSNKDDCKRIIKSLQKIKIKMGKENIEKDTIISVENCIRALQSEEVLKENKSNENNDDYPEIIEALQKIKKKMEKDKVAKEKINSVEKCIKSLQIKKGE